MDDNTCVHFLQWALPRIGFRWKGFRKVRRQVCKRIAKRIAVLDLVDLREYRNYLEHNADEWLILDQLCRVTISRFYRDHFFFEYFGTNIFPSLIKTFKSPHCKTIRIWSGGCASGEEPYTIALLWHFLFYKTYPDLSLEIIGTDIDPLLIWRAEKAWFPKSSLRELPIDWITQGFEKNNEIYLLKKFIAKYVRFELLDIRDKAPAGKFHAVLCRNLAFTYFSPEMQQKVLRLICDATENEGMLITGTHECIECDDSYFTQWIANMPIYQKTNFLK